MIQLANIKAVGSNAMTVIVCAGLLFLEAPKEAGAADEIFSVTGIEVDATAASAQLAQERAIAEGQVRGLRLLLETMTRQIDHEKLPVVTQAMVDGLLLSFEVANERRSAERYLADLTANFAPQGVRKLLTQRDIPFAESKGGPVLMLPVIKEQSLARLWDEPNPWRDAWFQREQAFGLVDITLPLGELSDVATLDVSQAVGGDEARILGLTRRYEANAAFVAVAEPVRDAATGAWAVDLDVRRYGALSGPWIAERIVFPSASSVELALAAAADIVADRLETSWKEENILDFTKPATLAAEVRAEKLEAWIQIKNKLEELPRIREINIKSLARQTVRLDIAYLGDLPQLASTLSAKGLRLIEEDGAMVLDQIAGASSLDPIATLDPTDNSGGAAAPSNRPTIETPSPEPEVQRQPVLAPPSPDDMLVE